MSWQARVYYSVFHTLFKDRFPLQSLCPRGRANDFNLVKNQSRGHAKKVKCCPTYKRVRAHKSRQKTLRLVASNAIQAIDNETAYLVIYCLNCIRRDENLTYKIGLMAEIAVVLPARVERTMLQLLL